MGRDIINFAQIAESADLRRMVEAVCGPPGRNRKYRCCFHADDSPSLAVSEHHGRTRFRCYGCNASGDAVDFLRLTDGLDAIGAAKALDPSIVGADGRVALPRIVRPPVEPKPEPPPPWHDPAWQTAAAELVERAEETLWSPAGRASLAWLRGRGLEDHVIRRFHVGCTAAPGWTKALVPKSNGTIGAIQFERGVTIPWPAPGSLDTPDAPRLCGVNVRALAEDPHAPLPPDIDKCRAIKGSRRGHGFPWPELLPTEPELPALLVEGEFDALVAWSEVNHVAHVISIGGANQSPQPSAREFLDRCPIWLVALDADRAGDQGAWKWIERNPDKARRIRVPVGKDLNDLHLTGPGKLAEWVEAQIRRLCPSPEP